MPLVSPVDAQRIFNSSQDFFRQGTNRLEREIQQLQINPGSQSSSVPLKFFPGNSTALEAAGIENSDNLERQSAPHLIHPFP